MSTLCPVSGQTSAEELVNVITHGLGLILAVTGCVFLASFSWMSGDPWIIVSGLIYGGSLIGLYLISSLYHRSKSPQIKRRLKLLDHICIYLFIAGTYTPITLIAIRDELGWLLFGIVWGGALLGSIFKIFFVGRFKILSTSLYVVMGWLCVVAMGRISQALSDYAFQLLWLGGISYTLGAVFYSLRRLPYHHGVFHVLVMFGSACHYFLVLSII